MRAPDRSHETAAPEDAVHNRRDEAEDVASILPPRINASPDNVEQGLARLVLTLIDVIRKVLEHQAVRRMEGGTLSDGQIEQLGLTLMQLKERLDTLKQTFGLTDEDLEIDLGPLGHLG